MTNKLTLRITSGHFKNFKLDVGPMTKPVKEVVKLSVFSKLAGQLTGAKCLDLFAGSGNLGIEAISRGASHVKFVEISGVACKIIESNILNAFQKFQIDKPANKYEIIRKDSLDFVSNDMEHYDIIFLDPPYDSHNTHLIKNINQLMHKDSALVFFRDKNIPLNVSTINPALIVEDSRSYGLTMIDFIKLI